MVSEIEKLQEQFEGFKEILGCRSEEITPHIELIDFGLLLQTFQETLVCLQQAKADYDQMDKVRGWFITRIKGYCRAEAAILRQPLQLPQNLEDRKPIELLHQFEEAAARLRKSGNSGGQMGSNHLKADMKEYQGYKS